MTNRTFTDDATGEKFELESTITGTNDYKSYVIKPLPKPESEKEFHSLKFELIDHNRYLISEMYQFTPEQGERVAEAITTLMGYINNMPGKDNDKMYDLRQTARAAREAVQRGVE